MKTIEIKAPAKVNYRLDVLRKRSDGYHDVRMIMQQVDLCDDILINLTDKPGIRVSCGSTTVPDGPANIAWRAANAISQLSEPKPGIDIVIRKNIPVAAGLGGGSSDGAAVLMGLNKLLELGLSSDKLREIGVSLGADVPFFIFGKTALAEGIGERLTLIEKIPPLWLVLVNPNIHISTAWVYQNLHLTSDKDAVIIPRFYENVADLCAVLANDLETVTIGRFPIIRLIKERLLKSGAAGALMSGSGSTVFGVFENEATARQAAEELAVESGWFATAVKTL